MDLDELDSESSHSFTNIQIKQNQPKENGEGKEETNVEEKRKGSIEEEEDEKEMKAKEEKKVVDVNKGFDEVMSIAEKHIETVNAMYSLGVSWLKDENDLSGGKDPENPLDHRLMDEEEENKEMERMDMRTWRCDDIKIEMDELENTVIVDQTNVKLKLEDCKMELTEYAPLPGKVECTTVLEYPCLHCEFKTSSSRDLKIHFLNVHTELTHRCKQCKFVGLTKELLTKHKRTAHNEGGELLDFKPKIKTFNVKAAGRALLKAMEKEDAEKEFICRHCQKVFGKRKYLTSHLKNVHEGMRYYCDECQYSSSYQQQLKLHKDSVHRGIIHACDRCEFVTALVRNLTKHKILTHGDTGIVEGGPLYPCEECEYVAGLRSNLRIHVEDRHKKLNVFMCDQCDHRVSTKANLEAHIESKHKKRMNYPCDLCDYMTHSLACLKKHRLRHDGQHLCDQCPYIGKLKADLNKHKKVKHEGFGYPCDQCNYSGPDRSKLRLHKEAVHMGVKYTCEICDFAASTKDNLRQHKACKHDDTKYPCDLCDHEAATPARLRKHMKIKHTDNSISPVNLANYSDDRYKSEEERF
ncbi:zinc finger protein 708 isoform X2 [Eurytemora carolleeae]|uniref:zinc finger protein 708 isoform X2 n=1 Tax=Eurytemora carolleeae TaxID=1294199 RepID=UPI000C781EFC|nr:zinc finger protein 708 isoform X2 [Eurytemora carolleeae]|eukprot:XP_023321196.1 zinc finger protein 708-like isoform X2 [Eurytemora affinis]